VSEGSELVLDRLIHEPARLAILTMLSSVATADFVFLQRSTGLTQGNLSSHLTKLEKAGLVRIEKSFVGKRPNTNVALTSTGKERIASHWDQLDQLKRRAATLASDPEVALGEQVTDPQAGQLGQPQPGVEEQRDDQPIAARGDRQESLRVRLVRASR
jgi:DNA-binding MarR family transcriptional regulator